MTIDLKPKEIHLWIVSTEQIQDKTLLNRYHQILSTDEVKRNKRFFFEKDRKQNLITRVLIREVLSKYIDNIAPRDWRFVENDYGKPEVVPQMLPFPLKFNVSHTANMIVLAIAKDQDIGVDVETFSRDIATDDLAHYAFSPKEYEQLTGLKSQEFQERFFDFWTLKEAYIKACGMGLSIPLNSFSFTISDNKNISIQFNSQRNDDPAQWRFWQIKPQQKFSITLATKCSDPEDTFQLIMRNTIPLLGDSLTDYKLTMQS
jgi:4'-phosphopantetheinyl transferase